MLKRLLIGGAVAASIFGIAGASASALTDTAQNGAVVQQSDVLNATCTNGGSGAQFQMETLDGNLVAVRMYQQDFNNCAGVKAQAIVDLTDGTKVYSAIDTLDGGGLDTYLTFPGTITAKSVKDVQLTLAGWISNSHGGTYFNAYGGPADHTAP